MAAKKNETAAPEVTEDKKERKVRTPEERIADMEAELKAAREKLEAKSNREANVLQDKLKAKRDRIGKLKTEEAELVAAIREIDATFEVAADENAELTGEGVEV